MFVRNQKTSMYQWKVYFVLLVFGSVLNAPYGSYLHVNATDCEFPAMFNFGDSNSDTGGLSSAFGAAPPPNGETFFHKPAGRYCDGRLVIDFIAESLGLPYLSAYLQSVGSNFSHGANFATAGSTIRPQNTTLRQSGFSPFSLDVQSWQFNQFKDKSIDAYNQSASYKDALPKPEYFNKALYTFDIGQNDLTAGFFLNMTVDQVRAFIPDVISQFSTIIKNLHFGGGMFFLIHNTGPFGCLPYVLDRLPHSPSETDKYGCAIPYNEVAQDFNRLLKEEVIQLRKDLPKAAITYVNMYSIKYGLVTNATKEGFKYTVRACCGHGGQYNYNRNSGCGSKLGKSCEDPSIYLNWDGVHNTEASNHHISRHVISGEFSDPLLPVSQICQKPFSS
ncbi:hypothetical protein SUGI_0084530 [Cryptomeria japonica]|uniref:GDSL esterase/lipase At3g26430 n=1 Tax=Cryptomeria japonica TaxID=3369 RepID=UPI002408A70D|nr:GDSL esterase/lipase At3g26430 [Cryptomeria japonica]GLJ08231.1 hypothetical protein SUGI_0084530 [Cryptomeria japonica]